MNKIYRFALTVLTSVSLAACSSGGEGTSSSIASGCETLTFASTQVESMGTVRITNLSGQFLANVEDTEQVLYAQLSVNGAASAEQLEAPLYVSQQNGNTVLDLVLPVNPYNPYTTSELDTTLVAGNTSCAGETLVMSGLIQSDLASGNNTVTKLQDWLVQRASAYNIVNWADLQQRLNDFVTNGTGVPLGLLSILMATDSAEKVINAYNAATDAEKILFASVMDKLGYATLLNQRIISLQTLGVEPDQSQTAPFQVTAPTTTTGVVLQGVTQSTSSACAAITGGEVYMPSAASLNYYMKRQAESQSAVTGELGGFNRKTAMAAAPLLGLASGGLATGVGAVMFIEYTIKEYEAKTLPGEFVDMQVDLLPASVISEDYGLYGKKLTWQNARVWAKSQPHNLTGPAVDAFWQVVGAGRWVASANKTTTAVDNAFGVMKGYLENQAVNYVKATVGNADCLAIPAYDWGPIDVSDELWTKAEVIGNTFTLGTRTLSGGDFNQALIGSSTFRLSTLTADAGGNPIFGGKTPIVSNNIITSEEVHPSAAPAYHRIQQLGEQVTFSVFVSRSEYPDEPLTVAPLPPGVNLVSGPTPLGGGEHQLVIQAPLDRNLYPATIEVYRPENLPGSTPRRSAFFELIAKEKIILTPQEACLKRGNTLTLTAELRGFDPAVTATWSVIQGPGVVQPVSQSGGVREGTFSSSTDGTAIIEVSAIGLDGSVIKDQSRISIGGCNSNVFVAGQFQISAKSSPTADSYNISDFNALPLPPAAPLRPDAYWRGRLESFSSPVSATGTKEYFDTLGNVATLTQTATGSGQATYEADANGGVTYTFDYSGTDECANHPIGDTSKVACSNVMASDYPTVYYYADITHAQSFMMNLNVDCVKTGSAWGRAVITAIGTRFDQAGNIVQEMPFFTGGVAQNACASGGSGVYTFSKQVDIPAPSVSGSTDELVFIVTLLTMAGNNHYAGYDISDSEFAPLPTAPPLNGVYPEESPGNYQGTTTINASISFHAITP